MFTGVSVRQQQAAMAWSGAKVSFLTCSHVSTETYTDTLPNTKLAVQRRSTAVLLFAQILLQLQLFLQLSGCNKDSYFGSAGYDSWIPYQSKCTLGLFTADLSAKVAGRSVLEILL